MLVSQAVNFGLLLLILYFVLYKPITKKLEERAERIKKGLEDAETSEKLLAESEAQRQEALMAGEDAKRRVAIPRLGIKV